MTLLKIDTWIKAGYELLGKEGVEGIKVERLARNLGLNKSGFYYYFNTMEGFLKNLLEFHVRMANEVAAGLRGCNTVDPDVLMVIVRFKLFFLVESQLLASNRNPHFQLDINEAGRIINEELIRMWQRTGNMQGDTATVLAYLNIIRHFFYARITAEEIEYEFLHQLAVETRDVLEKVSSDRHSR